MAGAPWGLAIESLGSAMPARRFHVAFALPINQGRRISACSRLIDAIE